MTRVFIADTRAEERFALQVLLRDLDLEVVGEASDWVTTLAQAPASGMEMLLVDWDVMPEAARDALDELRRVCPPYVTILLISRLDARQQAAVSSGADAFVSKMETGERIVDQFRSVAESIRERTMPTCVIMTKDYSHPWRAGIAEDTAENQPPCPTSL